MLPADSALPSVPLHLDYQARTNVLRVRGPVTLATLRDAKDQFARLQTNERLHGVVDASEVTELDTAGALYVQRWAQALAGQGRQPDVRGLPEAYTGLLDLMDSLPHEAVPEQTRPSALMSLLVKVGQGTLRMGQGFMLLLTLLGQICTGFAQVAMGRRTFRWNACVRHMREAGIQAIPIVMLLSFLMSVVLAYQGIAQLQAFGAQQFTVNFIAIGFLREMGGIIAAMMVAGRSGSAFTSEIGVMRIREEVDALKIMGLDPIDVLVLPRIAALIVVLPLLTFLAFIAGLLGGAIVSLLSLGMSFGTYLERFAGAVTVETAMIGLIKAPVFAVFIGLIGCLAGLQVQGSAESVGRQTTKAVVQGITAILLLDALFSILFVAIGW